MNIQVWRSGWLIDSWKSQDLKCENSTCLVCQKCRSFDRYRPQNFNHKESKEPTDRPTDWLPRASIFALSISTRIETRWPNSFVRRGLTRAFSFVFSSLVICHTRFYSRAMLEKKNWYMTIYSNIYNTRIMKLGSQEVRETVWPWSHFFLFHTNRSQEELTVFTELNAITMNEPTRPCDLYSFLERIEESAVFFPGISPYLRDKSSPLLVRSLHFLHFHRKFFQLSTFQR